MWFFRSPTIIHGEGALDYLCELEIARAFVVTDHVIASIGLLDRALQPLRDSGAALTIFDAVEPEPSLETIQRGAQAMTTHQPEWIIAVGGGSVMDAAKAMWVLYENPGVEVEALAPMQLIQLRRKARLVAIPTTAGTGSEATWAFVITVPGDPPRKLGSGHPLAMPDFAIVDPAMSADAPPQVTADSGMDALTQAIEGFLANWANDYTDGICLAAARLALEYLPHAYHHPDDLFARERMANSATLSGLGYINSMVGLAHSMGHALGAIFRVPHGRAVGLCLPYVLRFYGEPGCPPETAARLIALARALELPHDSAHSSAQALAARVAQLAGELGQPLTIAALGITAEQFEAALPALVESALSDTVIFNAPRQPSEDELRELFRRAFHGH